MFDLGALNPLKLKMMVGGFLLMGFLLATTVIWAMWERNGKLSCGIKLEAAKGTIQALGKDIEAQNMTIMGWKKAEEESRRRAKIALAQAEKDAQAKDAELDRIRGLLKKPTPDGASCNTAWEEIESKK